MSLSPQPFILDSLPPRQGVRFPLPEAWADTSVFAGWPVEIISGNFLGPRGHSVSQELLAVNGMEWMGYLILAWLMIIAILWYFLPDRLFSIFRIPEFSRRSKPSDPPQNSEGLLINSLLTINFVISMSLFCYLCVDYYNPYALEGWSVPRIFGALFLVVFGLFLIKMLIISFTGLIFNTRHASVYQNRLYMRMNNLVGVLMLLLLFFMVYWSGKFLLIAGILLIISVQILKWYASFFNVISVPGILLFHIIVYLCTLEIIPLLVIIKLLNSGLA